jgi:hypothetical protein
MKYPSSHVLRDAMDKHENIYIYIVVETFKGKGPRKGFGCFWFLVVPPKDGFAH